MSQTNTGTLCACWQQDKKAEPCTYFRPTQPLQKGSWLLPSYSIDLLSVTLALWAPKGLGQPLPLTTSVFCWHVPPRLGVWTLLPSSCLCLPLPSHLICFCLHLWSFWKKSTGALGYHYWPLCVPNSPWSTVGFLANLRPPGPQELEFLQVALGGEQSLFSF